VPGENFNRGNGDVNLLCNVEVIWIDQQPGGLGVACRIDHYSLIIGQ